MQNLDAKNSEKCLK